MRTLSDLEIIESVLRGNINDFSTLISRYKNRAFSLLLKMLRNRMEAEEALQDSFIKAYNNLQAFRKESSFGTWFYRIVYNTGLTRLNSRNHKAEKQLDSIEEFENTDSFRYEEGSGSVKEILHELIEKLPFNYRMVIMLYYINGYTCAEVAEITKNSESNVKVILHRARTALKDKISELNLEKELI